MKPAESIVEAYFRYCKRAFTKTNFRAVGQVELDLIGVNHQSKRPLFYHVESSVSISGGFSKITTKPYSKKKVKERGKMAGQRRTAGFFINEKFYSPNVMSTLKEAGCDPKNLERVLVAWDFEDEAQEILEKRKITCLKMKKIFQELAIELAQETRDLDSDILRTIQLFVRSNPELPPIKSVEAIRRQKRKERLDKDKP